MTFGKSTLSFIIILFLFFSCIKIETTYVMKGKWELEAFYINNGNTNFMYPILPLYSDGNDCCHYYIYFEDKGVAKAKYYTYDTLNYAVTGEWEMLDDRLMYINLDKYVNGIFEVKINTMKDFQLYSKKNYMKFYNIGETELTIDSKRL
jgi:hypothetical protein